MIIWSGFGYLTILIPIAVIWVSRILLEPVLGGSLNYDMAKWPLFIALVISSVILFFVDKKLEKEKGRIVIDKATGKEIVLKRKNAMFFIDIKYWPYIITVLGIISLIK